MAIQFYTNYPSTNYTRKMVIINKKRYVLIEYIVHNQQRRVLFYTNGRRIQSEEKEIALLALI